MMLPTNLQIESTGAGDMITDQIATSQIDGGA